MINEINEIWKDIPNYKGYYQCSNYGNIKSLERNIVSLPSYKFISGRIMIKKEAIIIAHINKGYYRIKLYKDNKYKNYYVHQLVAITFLNHNIDGLNNVINHKDNNKLNNYIDNLEICDMRYNNIYSIDKTKTTSIYTGVCWDKKIKKWRSQINYNNSIIYLGIFDTEKEAHETYLDAKKTYKI